jgi:sec-independent protein translocase protein TatA
MSQLGTTEILILSLLIIVLFGGKKLPELLKGIADSIKEFKKAINSKSEE